jgi:hypothetical protein
MRKRFLITGSRVPALVGCHYESLNAYYQAKRFGKTKPERDFTSEAMAWGNDHEEDAYNAFLGDFKAATGRDDIDWRYSDGMHIWLKEPSVAGSPDACGYNQWGVGLPPWTLEIKCPYAGTWHEEDSVHDMFQKKPQHWIQMQVNMACCGSPFGAFYVWDCNPDRSIERRRIVILNRDEALLDWLRGKILWWKSVMEKDPPPENVRLVNGTKKGALRIIRRSTQRSIVTDRWYYGDDESTFQ